MNKELLDEYVEKYNIDKIFSFWGKYEIKLVKFNKGEIICSKDKKLNEIIFIVEGCAKIYYVSSEGKELYLALKKAMDMLGEMEFIGETNIPYINIPYVEAMSEVLAVTISIDRYKNLLNEDIAFNKYVIKCLTRKISLAAQNLYINQLHSKESRLALYILSNEENNIINENWTEISNLLAISYRQLMRILSKFCEEKLIKRVGKKGIYEIIDREKLKRLCEHIF